MIPAGQRPAIYDVIEKEYKGDYNAYVDAMYDTSILPIRQTLINSSKNRL